MTPTRLALEAALAADPDDPARHAAYADLLIEEGDPRGEFVRLQLALEDPDLPADRRAAIEEAASGLLVRHEGEWLGPLRPFATGDGHRGGPPVHIVWRRGWADRVTVGTLSEPVRAAVMGEPLARLMRELVVRANGESVSSRRATNQLLRYTSLTPLAGSPNVRNVRRLELGRAAYWLVSVYEGDVAQLVRQTPRLEHLDVNVEGFAPARVFAARLPYLHTLHVTTNNRRLPVAVLGRNDSLGNLRSLRLDLIRFLSPNPLEVQTRREPVYPDELMTLFRSESLRSLADLALRLPGLGDAGVDELILSGLVARLSALDLGRCDITDDGAVALAACPDVPRLKSLTLDGNYISPVGVQALAEVGVTVGPQLWDADRGDVYV